MFLYVYYGIRNQSYGCRASINQLQGVLNENYLAAEKIMALPTPNTSELKAILAKIDKSYDELVGAMASARKDTEAIVASGGH